MANSSLDLDSKAFEDLLQKSSELVLNQFKELETKKAYHDFPQKEVESWFDEPLPFQGMNDDDLLALTKEKVLDTATNNLGPYMYAYVMAGGSQMSIIAEKLAATINQNVGKWHLSPAINEVEKRVVQWAGEMTGFGRNIGGVLVSGGSAANLTGLTVARNILFEKDTIREKGLFNIRPVTVYSSTEVHGCVDKSIEELGIGTDHLRKIDTKKDFTINLEVLERTIQEDIDKGFTPFCIIGSAGTVNTGAIDDLTALSRIAKKYGLWFHVDGAYGGLAATLPSIKKEYKGMELADSVAVDFHKWLYTSFEVGCLLVRDWDTLKRTYFRKAAYLDNTFEQDKGRLDFNEHYFQLSRNAKALKVWMNLKFYGFTAIQEMMQKDIDLAHYLADQVEKCIDFELHSVSHLAVTCFQYKGKLTSQKEITRLNQQLIPALEKDGRVFIAATTLKGKFALRACLINHRMHEGTVDYLIHVVRDVGARLSES